MLERRNALLLLILALSWMPLAAQENSDRQPTQRPAYVEASAAPLPAALATAKTAFVSYAVGDVNIWQDQFSGGPDRAYNQLYAGLRSWGRYKLLLSPEGADLILELRFDSWLVADSNGATASLPRFQLNVLDGRTRVILWSFREYLDKPKRKGTHDERFDSTLADIVEDLKKLDARANPGSQPAAPSGVAQ